MDHVIQCSYGSRDTLFLWITWYFPRHSASFTHTLRKNPRTVQKLNTPKTGIKKQSCVACRQETKKDLFHIEQKILLHHLRYTQMQESLMIKYYPSIKVKLHMYCEQLSTIWDHCELLVLLFIYKLLHCLVQCITLTVGSIAVCVLPKNHCHYSLQKLGS